MKIELLDNQSAGLLPFAKTKLVELDKLRESLEAPFLSRTLYVGNSTIFIEAAEAEVLSTIRIKTELDYNKFILSSHENTFVFNIYSGKIKNKKLNPNAHGDTKLIPLYDGFVQFELDKTIDASKSSFKIKIPSIHGGDFATRDDKYKSTYFANENSIIGDNDKVQWIQSILDAETIGERSGSWGEYPAITVGPAAIDNWNNAIGERVFRIEKDQNLVREVFTWYPNINGRYPGDESFIARTGLYYGRPPMPEFDFFNPLSEIEVVYKGIVRRAFQGSLKYIYGFHELVTLATIDGEGEAIGDNNDMRLYAYFSDQPFTSISGDTEYHQSALTQAMAEAFVTCGFSGPYRSVSYYIPLPRLRFTPEVSIECVIIEQAPDTTSVSNVSIESTVTAIYENNFASFYHHRTQMLETDFYIDHAIDPDGKFLVVMEGEEYIEKITVIDIFGVRNKTKNFTPNDEYIRPGWQIILVSEFVNKNDFIVGSFIPQEDKSLEEGIDYFIPSHGIIEPEVRGSALLPSMAMVSFWNTGQSTTETYKIQIDDTGTVARLEHIIDECFFSGGTIGYDVFNLDGGGDTLHPEYLLSTTERFGAIGVGTNVSINLNTTWDDSNIPHAPAFSSEIITLPDSFFATPQLPDSFYLGLYSGELMPGNCVVEKEDGHLAPDGSCCDCFTKNNIVYLNCALHTTCGQTAEVPYPIGTARINIPDNTVVGSIYSVSGGTGDIEWNIPCFGYEVADSGSAIITSTEGCCGTYTITATDCCMGTLSAETKAPIGQWVLISDTIETMVSTACSLFYMSGIYKYYDVYRYAQSETYYRGEYHTDEFEEASLSSTQCKNNPYDHGLVNVSLPWLWNGRSDICGENPGDGNFFGNQDGAYHCGSDYYFPYTLTTTGNTTNTYGYKILQFAGERKTYEWQCL